MNHDDRHRALQKATERLEDVLSAAELGFWTWDIQADRVVGDRNIAFFYGLDESTAAEGTSAETFIERVEPDDRQAMRAELAAVLAAGGRYAIDYRVRGSDGKLRWVASRGRVQLDANQRAVSLNGIVQDVTERKNAEQRLLESEERLRLSTHAAELGLWVWHIAEDRVTWENDRAYEIFEVPRSGEPINAARFAKEIVNPEDAAAFKQAVADTIKSNRRFYFLGRIVGSAGSPRWIEFTGVLKRSELGFPDRIVGTVADVTAQKWAEQSKSFLIRLDDAVRPLTDADEITRAAAELLGRHLEVNRCAYASVGEDEDSFHLTGDFNIGVASIVGHYTFQQFGDECLALMRAGEPYVVTDSEADPRVDRVRESYRATQIRSVVCVPMRKRERFVAAMAVHQATPRRWREEEVDLVQQVASRCWESIERARVTLELREREQRLHLIAQSVPQMIWTATAEGALNSVSVQATRYFDAEEATVLGAGWLQWVHPDDQQGAVERWLLAIKTGETYETSFRLLRASDMSWRWHLVRALPQVGDDGQVLQWFGTCTDFEDQKQAQADLAGKARLAALGSDIGVALTQIAGLREALQQCAQALARHLDGAFARIWTLSQKEDVLELQASAGLYTHIDGAHARVPVGSFKIGMIAKERRAHLTNNVANDPRINDPAWARKEGMVAFAGYPLVVEDRLIGVLGMFARQPLGPDIITALASVSATIAIGIERKRTEEELARHAAELQRSNEDLEQFAHVASHDLRSPLNTVLNFTELLVRRHGTALDPEINKVLAIVRDGAKRMGELVSALLVYSRLNDDASRVVLAVSSLAACEDAVANLNAAIQESSARIERDALPDVRSNPALLRQVFQNLISNAINYRGEAPPQIRVTAELLNGFWVFSVSDNGPGIAPQFHARIFEPFKRLHGPDRPGSGIGLAFCRKFIERDGGRIWVESAEGKGATFRFTVPALEKVLTAALGS